MRYDGEVPCVVSSPQDIDPRIIMTVVSHVPTVQTAFVMISTLYDARRDEDQQLAAFVFRCVTPEQPSEERHAVQVGHALVRDLLPADEDSADDRRRAVVDLHLRA